MSVTADGEQVEFMTVPEVAATFRLAESTIWAALKRGEFTRVKVGGSTRIPAAEVRAKSASQPATTIPSPTEGHDQP